ncbi:MAG: hypothetical protein V9E94_04225, partial [Microthrixaceae bacterium]
MTAGRGPASLRGALVLGCDQLADVEAKRRALLDSYAADGFPCAIIDVDSDRPALPWPLDPIGLALGSLLLDPQRTLDRLGLLWRPWPA